MNKRLLGTVVATLLMVCLLLVVRDSLGRRQSVFGQLDVLVDVRHEILHGFVEDPDETSMIQAAVRGMLNSLEDPHTIFLAPDEIDLFEKYVEGSFSGIGAMVELDRDEKRLDSKRLRIVSPLEESPAWESGVMAGDIVLEIDGVDTKGMLISECIKRLTGLVGTKVAIKVRHPTDEDQLLTITRAQINIQTIKGFRRDADHRWQFMLDEENRIGYIRVTQFTKRTPGELRKALDSILARQIQGIILDLRYNAGGLLPAAVEVSDMFLGGGERIVSVKGRAVPEKVYLSKSEGTVPPIEVVVLANEASASAAEIVTGALADNGRAKFIGMRTFGKGSVQQYKSLMDNEDQIRGALKMTSAYYYLPSGRNIHRREDQDVWGVDPEDGFFVPMTFEQSERMMKIRREGEILEQRSNPQEATLVTREWIEQDLADPQLAAALHAILGKVKTDQWPVVGQPAQGVLIKQAKRASLTRRRDLLRQHLDELDEELTRLEAPQDDTPMTVVPNSATRDSERQMNPALDNQ